MQEEGVEVVAGCSSKMSAGCIGRRGLHWRRCSLAVGRRKEYLTWA